MSAFKSILLHLDASPRSEARLRLTQELAALHGARVTALYASTPGALNLPYAMAEGAGEAIALLQQLDVDRRDDARRRFDRSNAEAASPMHWAELRNEPVVSGVAARALFADLLVLGQYDPGEAWPRGVPADFVQSVIIASGRPALVFPFVDICATLGQNPLIAWKATREAAHAVSAALPMLQRAKQIHLTAAPEADGPGPRVEELIEYLRLHGVEAPIERHAPVPSASAGDGLLSLAADSGADLLVMGCYGHTRARELMLGGASRMILKSMTLPVLLAH
ncbi:MAG: universal stress protein [Burkholderiales bacterium]